MDESTVRRQLSGLQGGQSKEIIFNEISRGSVDLVHQVAQELQLYSKTYGKGRSTVVAVSKTPLPNYRPDLDKRLEKKTQVQSVDMSNRAKASVERALQQISTAGPENIRDDAGEEDDGAWDDDGEYDFDKQGGGSTACSEVPSSQVRKVEGSREPVNDPAVNNKLREELEARSSRSDMKKMMEGRKRLPSFSMREEVLSVIRSSRVVVVSGETGCGKTTQVPQFILDDMDAQGLGSQCNIICTQPRRISAISVADRVANERCETLGDTVGYQIRLEVKRSERTRLLFCTTGVLLRRLVVDPELSGVSHVIVDEIHERGINEDFILIILKDLLRANPSLKIVLMSATLNAQHFQEYFSGCPLLHIPGFTFPEEELSTRYAKYSNRTKQNLLNWDPDKTDLDVVLSTLEFICEGQRDGAVLVFLTGWDEISKLLDKSKESRILGDSRRVRVLPLHGSMPTVNQREIFDRPPPGIRKVILSTNIAETSITIDDIVFVVDTGKVKQDGVCYKLYPSSVHEKMEEYQVPEILRTPLEELCLQIKALSLGFIESFLLKAMNPPDKAFEEWRKTPPNMRMEFCRRNFLSGKTLEMISDMRKQFADLLRDIGFLEQESWEGDSSSVLFAPHWQPSLLLLLP
ncbi:hypothetical protein GUITHDRAFT_143740 [Guillardia theta CCMP2712]|uniref:Helicase ATP-binding domain-containing protein n=1 Tax=Guillardia theta (strain CCMP2712) TaxID=905079 RepID=L1ISB5_GUITC|nr:hypothetical protein GUITHDRAFT_143740 [Guillardia theta CCMP2712]EKX39133.1 hypothetical protein GUITHDRAFT_143740 [Guillardia theta CCMP2712]|eukprot:XP_005826113.1 hypothetical protein GUITHDRAFT_143740 [Guillardia theta CCMP2712]